MDFPSLFPLLPLDVLKLILYQTDFRTVLNLRLTCKQLHSKLSDVYNLWFKFEHPLDFNIVKWMAIKLGKFYWKYKNKIHYLEFTCKYGRSRKRPSISLIYYCDTDHNFPKCLANHNKINKFMQHLMKGRILIPFSISSQKSVIYRCNDHFQNQHHRLKLEKTEIKSGLIDIFNYMQPLKFAKILSGHYPSFKVLDLISNPSFPIKIPIEIEPSWDIQTVISVLLQFKFVNFEELIKALNITLMNEIRF